MMVDFNIKCDTIMRHGENIWDIPAAWFVSADRDGEMIYFSSWNFNGIFSMDTNTRVVRKLGKFADIGDLAQCLHIGIKKCKDTLWFFPHSAKNITSFDLKTHQFHSIEVRMSQKNGIHFLCVAVEKRDVWLLHADGRTIIRFNTENGHLKSYDMTVVDTVEFKKEMERGMVGSLIDTGNYLWYLYIQSNIIIRFDKEGESKLYRVGDSKYKSMCYDGEWIWLLDIKGIIVKWKWEDNSLIKIMEIPGNTVPNQLLFQEGKIFFFFLNSYSYYFLSLKTFQLNFVSSYISIPSNKVTFLSAGIVDGDIFLYTHGYSNCFFIIPNSGETPRAFIATLSEESKTIYRNCFLALPIIYEQAFCGLDDYITKIQGNQQQAVKGRTDDQVVIGNNIYKWIV